MAVKKSGVDQELIRELANILNETDLTEIEVEQEDLRIRVSRSMCGSHVHAPVAAPAATAPAPATAHPAATGASAEEKAASAKNTINSPMVGTAYLAPSPGTRAFVEVGQSVKEGQTILIIEAMKTMNQIPSPRAGKIVDILVEDGQPVEYGEPLIVLE